jgi:hypothetical protein
VSEALHHQTTKALFKGIPCKVLFCYVLDTFMARPKLLLRICELCAIQFYDVATTPTNHTRLGCAPLTRVFFVMMTYYD